MVRAGTPPRTDGESHGETWTSPVTYCGPGTTFRNGKCVGVHGGVPVCPAHQRMIDGSCQDIADATEPCKPFEAGKFYDAPPEAVYEFVATPFDCAKRCLDERGASHFVHSGNMKTCACLHMTDVADPSHDDARKLARCNADDKQQRITVQCGDKFSLFDATRHEAKTYQELKRSMCGTRGATSPVRLACDDPHQEFVRGETCNFDLGTRCGPGTRLEDGRCVALQSDVLKQYSRVPRGRCTLDDHPLHKAAEDVQHVAVPAKSEEECASACDATTPCGAAIFDATHRTCKIVSHCARIEDTGEHDTTLLAKQLPVYPTRRPPAENCGRNTVFDGSKCIGTGAPEFCGKNATLRNGKCVGPEPPGPQTCRPGTRWLPESKQCARMLSQGKVYCGRGTQWDGVQCIVAAPAAIAKKASAQQPSHALKAAVANEKRKTEAEAKAHKATTEQLNARDAEVRRLSEQLASATRDKERAVSDAKSASAKTIDTLTTDITNLKTQTRQEREAMIATHMKDLQRKAEECQASKAQLRTNLIGQLQKTIT